MATANPNRWFPNATEVTPALQRIFQRVLTYVYNDEAVIASQTNQIEALQKAQPSGIFPAHYNTLGNAGTIAYDTIGNVYVCYAANLWVRLGPSGTSTAF